jgi:Flp pilus assembly protein TadD
VPNEPHYEDVAGVVYLKRMRASGQREPYDRASSLLDSAANRNRFDPYILIHRIDLETTAMQQKIVAGPSDSANRAVAKLIDMDPNNATVQEAVGRLRLAEGRPEAALASIRKAEELRPHHPRYHLAEGDALRSLGDTAAAISPYRQETAILAAGDRDWAIAEEKLILALMETGQHQTAADEAIKVVARVPADAVAGALLGFAYLRLNEVGLAKAAFSAALAADPTSVPARQGLQEVEQMETAAAARSSRSQSDSGGSQNTTRSPIAGKPNGPGK